MRALLLLLLLSPAAKAQETPSECPRGTHRVSTNDPYHPFDCVKADAKKGFGSITGPQGFKARPKCPRGTHAAASNDGMQRYRCVRTQAGGAEPDISAPQGPDASAFTPGQEDPDPLTRGCPAGTRKVRTKNPQEPFQCAPLPRREEPLRADSYRRYTVAAEMSFDYPRTLQPRDGWKEEVPALSFTLDDGSPGKPVMITITKVHPSQPTYIDLDAAVSKDKEWQNAKDGGSVPVAGVKARITFVSGESKTAYIPLTGGAYYAIAYSAPVESYDLYLGAFDRLMKTMKITRSGK